MGCWVPYVSTWKQIPKSRYVHKNKYDCESSQWHSNVNLSLDQLRVGVPWECTWLWWTCLAKPDDYLFVQKFPIVIMRSKVHLRHVQIIYEQNQLLVGRGSVHILGPLLDHRLQSPLYVHRVCARWEIDEQLHLLNGRLQWIDWSELYKWYLSYRY